MVVVDVVVDCHDQRLTITKQEKRMTKFTSIVMVSANDWTREVRMGVV